MCALEEIEGVLSPPDIGTDDAERISTCPFLQGALGISPEIADTIDAILAAKRSTSFMKVDRSRLHESQEAWVHVLLDAPADDAPSRVGQFKPRTYLGPIFGFGASRGVLTWPNSDWRGDAPTAGAMRDRDRLAAAALRETARRKRKLVERDTITRVIEEDTRERE